jgi:hypothetical protein
VKAILKAAAYRYVNGRNLKVLYITVALMALVLGAGAPDGYGVGGGGGGG